MARRGDPDALALLRGPPFPECLGYLFDLYWEFLLWAPRDRSPEWSDWQAWAEMMERSVTPWELRQLRQIHDGYHRVIAKRAAH